MTPKWLHLPDHVTAADHYQLVALMVDGDLVRQAVGFGDLFHG